METSASYFRNKSIHNRGIAGRNREEDVLNLDTNARTDLMALKQKGDSYDK